MRIAHVFGWRLLRYSARVYISRSGEPGSNYVVVRASCSSKGNWFWVTGHLA